MDLTDNEILADAAKYEASCASSGAPRRGCGRTKVAPFIVTANYAPAGKAASSELLRRSVADAPRQMNLWPELQAA